MTRARCATPGTNFFEENSFRCIKSSLKKRIQADVSVMRCSMHIASDDSLPGKPLHKAPRKNRIFNVGNSEALGSELTEESY